MTVIINDFEIIPDQQKQSNDNGETQQTLEPSMVGPQDIRNIVRRLANRIDRIWAH